ncbi:hypothetical protein IAR50_000647 [Cryptococcus sp. DSM 104548]
MEALSRREEMQVMEDAKSQALKKCDRFVKDFADCATGRTFTLPFACKGKLGDMQACMKDYMSTERIDSMKLDFIAHRSEKGREAVEAFRKTKREKINRMLGIKEEQSPL